MSKSKSYKVLASILLSAFAAPCVFAQSSALQLANVVNTVVGTGTATLYGDGGPALLADLNQPQGIVTDGARNLYIADTANNVIRRVDSVTGVITTFAGLGSAGFSGDAGSATSAQLSGPVGVAMSIYGDLYIADTGNNRIRVVYAGGSLASKLITLENPSITSPVAGYIYTIAGGASAGSSGDLGLASAATLSAPQRIAVDLSGNVYISDTANNRVRVVYLAGTTVTTLIKSSNATVTTPTAGYVYTVVGTGTAGSTGDGAAAGLATINAPSGIAVDPLGNLFLAESSGNRVRVVFASGTLLGSLITQDAAGNPTPVATNIYTLIGTGNAGYSGDGALGSAGTLNQPAGLFVDSAENIYLADSGNHIVRRLTASTGLLSTLAGNNSLGAGFSGDQGLATAAAFGTPSDVTQDASGRVFIADGFSNARIRSVSNNAVLPTTAVGVTSTTQTVLLQINSSIQLASLAVVPSMGANLEYNLTPPSNCPLNTPLSAGTLCALTVSFTPAYPGQRNVPIAVTDSTGAITTFMLSGTGKGVQTAVTPGQLTTIVGTGVFGYAGDNGAATAAKINVPGNVAVDAAGNIFFSDKSNYVIRVIYKSGPIVARLIQLETGYTATPGSIYTIAGIGSSNGSASAANNVLATTVKLQLPTNMAIDANDNVYFLENSKTVRSISSQTGLLSTVAGTGSAGYTGDNGPATSAKLNTASGIAIDNLGNLYIADSGVSVIRKVVLSTGIITTVAGTGTSSSSGTNLVGDRGPATSALLGSVQGVGADAYGNVYIADAGPDQRIRVIYSGGSAAVNPVAHLILVTNTTVTAPVQGYLYSVAGNGTTSAAATGTTGPNGDGGLANSASMAFPYGVALDAAGNIYFPELNNNHIRRIDVGDGIIRTVGGLATTASPGGGASGDGGAATLASLSKPYGIAIDAVGNLYVADGSNARIRFITSTPYPVTFASTVVGSTSASQTVTAVSNGNLSYDFSAFAVNGQFAQVNSGTTLIPQCAQATPLFPGYSCTTALTFSPHSDGTVTGTEIFAGNAPTQTVQLSGTGTGGTASSTLIQLPTTAVYGSTVQVSAAVTAGGSSVTSGTVLFTYGAQTIATAPLNPAGIASATLPSYAVGNYMITATYSAAATANLLSSASSTISITPATLTVTANNQSLVYGQPMPSLTYGITGFVNNDSLSVVTGAPALSTTVNANSGDGQYAIVCTVGTLTATNYSFLCVNGTFTVSGATVQNITFNSIADQVYGATPIVLSPTSTSGLAVALAVFSGPARSNGYSVTVTGVGTVVLVATQAGDSVYRAATPVYQSFKVSPAPLNIVVDSASRFYGSSNPAFTGTVKGLVNGDTLGNTVLVSYSSAAVVSSLVGPYAISATVSGSSGANYTPVITQGTLTVQQAPLTVTANNATRTYGAANPTYSASVLGLVNGDSIGVNLLEGFSTTATATSAVGVYPINVTITGTSAAQYAVQTIPGVLSVTPATLNISANSTTRIYGTANPAFTGSVTGALNGDSFTEGFTTAATISTNAGRYSIVPNVTGPNLVDYTVVPANGTLQIKLADSQMTLSAAATVNAGTTVSFTATAATTTSGTPTGSIAFLDGSTLLATVPLTSGVAVYSTSGLLVGSHTISANYAGDYNFYGSSASASTIIVAAAGYTLTPSATSLTIASGGSGSLGIQATSVGGYTGTVTFACGNLPSAASCNFTPAVLSLTPASSNQATTLTISTSSSQASRRDLETPAARSSNIYLAFMPAMLGLFLLRRKHRQQARRFFTLSLAGAILFAAATSLSGCGTPASPLLATPKGTYSILVQSQPTSGSSNSFQLNVQVN